METVKSVGSFVVGLNAFCNEMAMSHSSWEVMASGRCVGVLD